MISKVLSDWNLSHKHLTFVLDNANDIKHALNDLSEYEWLGCTSHNLNLICKEATKVPEANALVVRCKNLVTHIRQSKNLMNFLLMAMAEYDFLPSLTVVQEFPTRWWSMLLMLQRIIRLWRPITSVIDKSGKAELMLSDADITNIKDIIELLKPFKEMSDTLEGEKYITVSMIQSFNVQIQRHLQPKSTDSSLIRKMKQPMLAKALTRHSGEALNIIKYSSMIDPRLKRRKSNVTEQMKEDFLALTISLNQGDQDSQSQIGPTQGQEYVNLSTILSMPSTSTSTVANDFMNIFDSNDDVDMGEAELSLE